MPEDAQPQNNINTISLFAFFLLGFAGVLGYQYLRAPKHTAAPSIATPTEITTTPVPTLALVPPTQALSGTLTIARGKADIFARGATGFSEASTGAQILLGEAVATKEDSLARIYIHNVATIDMESEAEVVFANLFAENMVLQQKAGKVNYSLVEGVKPVAIRALHALVSVRSGKAVVTIDETDISVVVKTGSVKLAMVDTENNTHVWDLAAGDRADIDDEARDVTIY
jgi:hypothetical protein